MEYFPDDDRNKFIDQHHKMLIMDTCLIARHPLINKIVQSYGLRGINWIAMIMQNTMQNPAGDIAYQLSDIEEIAKIESLEKEFLLQVLRESELFRIESDFAIVIDKDFELAIVNPKEYLSRFEGESLEKYFEEHYNFKLSK